MDPRRQRFKDYFDRYWKDNGGKKAFMAATGYKKARLSQLFDPTKPFGEVAGRKIAAALDLPRDFFEAREGALTRKALELARMFDAWPDSQDKDAWYAMVTSFLESKATPGGTGTKPPPFDAPTPAQTDSQETRA